MQLWLQYLNLMMKTPICDFIKKYKERKSIRLHMPGHKGVNLLGFEVDDITEIDGADFLYSPEGIICESEKNASKIFGCDTFYSTEGSSQCIRAMLFLALINRKNKENRPIVLATRNAHKTFISAAALLDFDVKWIYSKNPSHYYSCLLDANQIEDIINNMPNKPFALYLTSPDYLGNILPIEEIAKVCKKYGVPLLVDNAHGAYLKFIGEKNHPIDLGADMCCDSAHKTLPALTGAAYLHISNSTDSYYLKHAKEALCLFGSTSPSYLILQSLDMINQYIENNKNEFNNICKLIDDLKQDLIYNGYTIIGNEKMKITIDCKAYGYTGIEIAKYLENNNIICEFYDNDYVVLMPTPKNSKLELDLVKKSLLNLSKKNRLSSSRFFIKEKESIMSIRDASFSRRKLVKIEDSIGCILADASVSCPPAIPIVVCGERIEKEDIELFKYYGIEECSIVVE